MKYTDKKAQDIYNLSERYYNIAKTADGFQKENYEGIAKTLEFAAALNEDAYLIEKSVKENKIDPRKHALGLLKTVLELYPSFKTHIDEAEKR